MKLSKDVSVETAQITYLFCLENSDLSIGSCVSSNDNNSSTVSSKLMVLSPPSIQLISSWTPISALHNDAEYM